MKILIVDDDPAILKITQKLLALQGFEVHTCENALDAIQVLGDYSFDVLITDATMPAYSGFDLVRTIKKTEELSYLTVAMLTGRSEKSDIEQAVELGVDDYIVKPIEPEVFLSKVDRLVEKHRKRVGQKPKTRTTATEMVVPVTVTRFTDIGVTITGPYPLAKGTIVNIELPELLEAGIDASRFKAIFDTPIEGTKKHSTELLLLDISESQQNILAEIAKRWQKQKAS